MRVMNTFDATTILEVEKYNLLGVEREGEVVTGKGKEVEIFRFAD